MKCHKECICFTQSAHLGLFQVNQGTRPRNFKTENGPREVRSFFQENGLEKLAAGPPHLLAVQVDNFLLPRENVTIKRQHNQIKALALSNIIYIFISFNYNKA